MSDQGQVEQASSRNSSHAIVIGGSMAGLLAARALADHFDQVTILERDRLPGEPDVRKGVPQANHVHILLVRGYRLLQRLFPGIDAELDALEAQTVDFGWDVVFLMRTGWSQRAETELKTRSCSRALLEWCVRRRLENNPRVAFKDGCRVQALLAAPDKTRVTGVQVGEPGSKEAHPLYADLVVDASGRESHAPEWLRSLGYEQVEETEINSFVGYASRRYRLRPDFQPDWKFLFVFARPPKGSRGGALMHEEGDIWVATVAGVGRDYPPTDEENFLKFAQTLPSLLLYQAIKDAEPLTPVYGYQRTSNRWRHYEKFSRWPEGFLVVGDAVCAFNPIYGQGMTVSAMAAELLDEMLRAQRNRNSNGGLTGMAKRFQRRLAKMNQMPWLQATGEDLRYPETEGRQPSWLDRMLQRYFDQVLLVTTQSADVGLTVAEVFQLLTPPAALFRPGIVARVLRQVLTRRQPMDATADPGLPPPRPATA